MLRTIKQMLELENLTVPETATAIRIRRIPRQPGFEHCGIRILSLFRISSFGFRI